MTTIKIAGVGAALLLFGTGAYAATAQTTPRPQMVAQATPTPEESPTAMPAATPQPASSPEMTAPATTAPVTPPGTIDLKQGGLQGNSNGANWIDKFNRKPGPDTSGAMPRAAHATTVIKMKKVKVRTTPVPPPH